MASLIAFRGYEQVEGHEPGHINLLARENVLEDYGMPEVDFDNLSRMYTDELALKAGKWTVKLFHGRWSGHADPPLSKLSLGYHILGSNTIHSAVWSGGYHFSLGHGPERSKRSKVDRTDAMRKLIRQSVGVSEGRTRKLMLAKERALHAAGPTVVLGLVAALGATEWASVAAGGVSSAPALSHYRDSKASRREAKEVSLHEKHQRDIIFPDSPLTLTY